MQNTKEQLKEIYELIEMKGDKVTVVKDSSLYKIVYDLHDGMLPNDWIFDRLDSLISNSLDYDFDTKDELENYRHEIVDSLIDIMTSDLLEWQESFSHFTDEAREEGLGDSTTGVDSQIQAGQYLILDRMFNEVINLIEEE